MDRRAFLSALVAGLGGAAAHAMDVDRLLWVPGRQTIVLPPAVTSCGPGLVLKPWAPGLALKVGEVITIPGHYAMNPYGVSTGALRLLTVTSDYSCG